METTTLRYPAHPEDYGAAAQSDSHITLSTLVKVLRGVCIATGTPERIVERFERCLSSQSSEIFSNYAEEHIHINRGAESWFSAWSDALAPLLSDNDMELRHLLNLALVISFLRESSHHSMTVNGEDLTILWKFVHNALTSSQLTLQASTVSYSAQGFFVIPLCGLIGQNGSGDELYRLQIWLPDSQRNPQFRVHSYQAFIKSWILAGNGKYSTFNVEITADPELATHTEIQSKFRIVEGLAEQNNGNQNHLMPQDSRRSVRAIKTGSSSHTINMSYRIEPGTWHSLEVAPDSLHAGIFLLKVHLASETDVRIIGPKNVDLQVPHSDKTDITSALVAANIHAVRSWELLFDAGKWHARQSEMEDALRVFNSALSLCKTVVGLPNATHYARLVHGELGFTNRCLGRYDVAKEHLEEALKDPGLNYARVKAAGELGTVYRIQNQLMEARDTFQTQYETAKTLGDDRATCRAIGNVGMTNYQLSQLYRDDALLDLAIEQLKERVDRARSIKEALNAEKMDHRKKFGRLKHASVWESVGLNRLSLCYTAQVNTREAVLVTKEAQQIKIEPEDLTVTAMSHFFYGRALLRDGQRAAAMEHFNPSVACTPAIALCKEPSEENRQYMRELVDVGVDMEHVDEYGYTALDYAVFGMDTEMEAIVIEGLRHTLKGEIDAEIAKRQYEARLRKGYRELFHDRMRPVLLTGGDDTLKNLRIVYAAALTAIKPETMTQRFDMLKYVHYSDFVRWGKLPQYSEGFIKELSAELQAPQGRAAEFIIFFSHRWIHKRGHQVFPDDPENSQYHRMVQATRDFLDLNPTVEPDGLGIWLDYACIDQDNPAPGIAALPMLLAQCDAVISLVDDDYYKRAWCVLETVMIQTLEKSYQRHRWYEHAPSSEKGSDDKEWTLRAGPLDLEITAANKELTIEEDRPKILFLERQTKLLR
ncbi:uncharacterized protein A1O5_11482 [Cladophialophora psammophila CBS 110553]|uniref:Heterokaryon incompatibility domain-containing protein n=1 Tax=Cladophialophora psammophila CBS 110553 TaxID=1182543 RepID=W9W655_9EURO|nr:uncharacterized protein A1O5_11482 [Cladophialophora psammophila CBS 110553]EXJ63433.1 hypothetical protein A1O5_11482 [Cladophialophora psammophila CBS 110553]